MSTIHVYDMIIRWLVLSWLPEIDECESAPCSNGGTCLDGIGGYMCLCRAGYTGDNCRQGEKSNIQRSIFLIMLPNSNYIPV